MPAPKAARHNYEQAIELAFALGHVLDTAQWAALHDIAVNEHGYATHGNPKFKYRATVLAAAHDLRLDHSQMPWLVHVGDLAIDVRLLFVRPKTRKARPFCPGIPGHPDPMAYARALIKRPRK